MITFLAVLVVLAIFGALVASRSRAAGYMGAWRGATAIAVIVRLGIFWYLLALHWRGTMGLWVTPLILLLLPEGFLLPRHFVWTLPSAILWTGLLAAGTAVWTAMAVGVVRALRSAARR